MSIVKVSTVGMSREEWLEERRHGIGGSDAGALVGMSKYASPYTVWLDKTGKLPDKEDTEAMRCGRDLEEYVARRFCEATGKKVRRDNHIIKNSLYPFAHANVDRVIVGENAGLECKTTSTLDLKQFRGVEFPERYYCQCVHYMAVTGMDRWYLAVLVYGKGFYTYTLERDQAEIDALMAAEAEFWPLVENNTPPALDGGEASEKAISTVYADSVPGSVQLFGREGMLEDYFRLKEQKEELEEQLGQIENTIKVDMGENDSGVCSGFKVSWKTQQRSTFQAKDFQRQHPEIPLDCFYKISSSRPFKVTRMEA